MAAAACSAPQYLRNRTFATMNQPSQLMFQEVFRMDRLAMISELALFHECSLCSHPREALVNLSDSKLRRLLVSARSDYQLRKQ